MAVFTKKRVVFLFVAVFALAVTGLYIISVHFDKSEQKISQTSKKTDKNPSDSQLSDTRTQTKCIAALPDELKLAQKIMPAAYTSTLMERQTMLETLHIGGVLLMDDTPRKTISAFTSSQTMSPFVATDQEGGTVQRYGGDAALPSQADITKHSTDAAYDRYRKSTRALKALGITTNFAPVLGVKSGKSPLPGRFYSSGPDLVSSFGKQAVSAGKSGNIDMVVKHFPGLGTAIGNTDFGSAKTDDYAALKKRDLIPFKSLAALHPDLMMSNAVTPGLTDGKPASQSKAAVSVARDDYGFRDSIIYTDSLTAKAIPGTIAEASVKSWEAGIDIALFVQTKSNDPTLETAYLRPILKAGEKALKYGTLHKSELNDSISRIFAQKHIDACKVDS